MIYSTPTYMTDYPFIVMAPRSRLVHVTAKKFSNALSRALSLYPNKFLKTQFARRMSLVEAMEEAKKLSAKSAHKQHVILLKNGDFEVENAFSIDDKADIYCTFHKGKKIDGPAVNKVKQSPVEEEPPVRKAPKVGVIPTSKEIKKELKQSITTKQTNNVMKTTKKSAPAKKEVKKEVSKSAGLTYRATRIGLTEAQWKKFDASGQKLQSLASEFAAKKFA